MYGTAWKELHTEALTLQAINCGYRAIDTANQRKHYVETAVGAALTAAVAASIATRESLFLQTKFTYPAGQDHRLPYDANADIDTQVHQSIESSLCHHGVTRIDSYILHAPSCTVGLSEADWQAWRAMEQEARNGRIGLLGVSNVSFEQLAALLEGRKSLPHSYRTVASPEWDGMLMSAGCAKHTTSSTKDFR